MKIQDYLDATYLKTPNEAGLTDSQNWIQVRDLVLESIAEGYKAVMIRPNYVKKVRALLDEAHSTVLLGTVIDFPLGRGGMIRKLSEAQTTLNQGANELDFVLDYQGFLTDGFKKIREEVLENTQLVLEHKATAKWIVETAAFPKSALEDLAAQLSETFLTEFGEERTAQIFLKSSTGYFSANPSGATAESIDVLLRFGKPFPVKASGGIRTAAHAKQFIDMGVVRIGTSSAKEICTHYE